MKDLIALRQDLDALIGPAKRVALFNALLTSTGKSFCLLRLFDQDDAERMVLGLRSLGVPADIEQGGDYPHLRTIWVRL